jgi:spore coat polysaccharide biosynthesis protein SpsF
VEVFNARILPDLFRSQPDLSPSEREHATLAVYTRQNSYKVGSFFVESNNSQHRWTLDTSEDYRFLFWLFEQFSHGSVLGLEELLIILKGTPEMIHLEP